MAGPFNGFGCPKCGLVDVAVWGPGSIAAEAYSFNPESIAGSENAAHIVHAPHVFKDHHDGRFLGSMKLLCAQALQFIHPLF
jgi:hypothetical protein